MSCANTEHQFENDIEELMTTELGWTKASELDEKCAAIDALIAEKEALIADLEAYWKSLIFEVVTGKREVA